MNKFVPVNKLNETIIKIYLYLRLQKLQLIYYEMEFCNCNELLQR